MRNLRTLSQKLTLTVFLLFLMISGPLVAQEGNQEYNNDNPIPGPISYSLEDGRRVFSGLFTIVVQGKTVLVTEEGTPAAEIEKAQLCLNLTRSPEASAQKFLARLLQSDANLWSQVGKLAANQPSQKLRPAFGFLNEEEAEISLKRYWRGEENAAEARAIEDYERKNRGWMDTVWQRIVDNFSNGNATREETDLIRQKPMRDREWKRKGLSTRPTPMDAAPSEPQTVPSAPRYGDVPEDIPQDLTPVARTRIRAPASSRRLRPPFVTNDTEPDREFAHEGLRPDLRPAPITGLDPELLDPEPDLPYLDWTMRRRIFNPRVVPR